MTVVVNAASARVGGGITYLIGLLPPLVESLRAKGLSTHVLTSPAVAARLRALPGMEAVRFHTPAWSRWPGLARLAAEQAALPRVASRAGALAVLNVGDTVPLLSRTPQVLVCRNLLLYDGVERTSLRLNLLRAMARSSIVRARAVIAVSEHLGRKVSKVGHPRQLGVVPHGPGLAVAFRERSVDHGKVVLALIGSVVSYKRIDLAVRAVAALRSRGLVVRLRVVGRAVEPDYCSDLAQLCAALKVEDLVEFTGERSPEEVAKEYDDASIALVTSSAESYCHPLVEALSAGVPVVVAADLAVAREIAGDAAVYAEPTADGIAAAVEGLLADAAHYCYRVIRGRVRAAGFSWAEAADRTADLLVSAARVPLER